jgi:hypothetical protein
MAAACWIMVAWYVLSIVMLPASVGKPRRPMTGGQAAFALVVQLTFGATLALVATGVLR